MRSNSVGSIDTQGAPRDGSNKRTRTAVVGFHRSASLDNIAQVAAFHCQSCGRDTAPYGHVQLGHVSPKENPADTVLRGFDLSQLAESFLWWHGPAFLLADETQWPDTWIPGSPCQAPDQAFVVAAACVGGSPIINDLIRTYSSLNKMLRVVSYCLRFLPRHRKQFHGADISPSEMRTALDLVCRAVQREAFPNEYHRLANNKEIDTSSGLLPLSPFLDVQGLTRVGGRLKNSEIPYDARHPILLPHGHKLTEMIVLNEHIRNLHSGLQSTISAVRARFWPLSVRSTTRKFIRKCIVCFKAKPIVSQAMMSDLPKSRVVASRPFSHVGVDYAGPISLKDGKRRNARITRAYITIFVCFATKATHIEIVTDLTSAAFIGAFKRFISRRGNPTCVYSDNGTNFVGAYKQLQEFKEFIDNERTQDDLRQVLCDHEIKWKFIPSHAPHFGGLWKSAVRIAKRHMQRMLGDVNPTYEELYTLLCEIEAILNSRPLTPLSSDPNDLQCLTPGHFIIGTALNSFPVPDIDQNPGRMPVRWQRVDQIRRQIWRRYHSEYLHTLMERNKWRTSKGSQLQTGQLVLILQPSLGPLQWTGAGSASWRG